MHCLVYIYGVTCSICGDDLSLLAVVWDVGPGRSKTETVWPMGVSRRSQQLGALVDSGGLVFPATETKSAIGRCPS